MLELPFFIRPNFKALAGGCFTYALLYWFSTAGAVAFTHLWFPSSSPGELKLLYADSSLSRFFAYVVFAQYLAPGFVAGFMARRAGLMHGLITGALLPIVTLIFLFQEFQFAPALVMNVLLPTLFLGLIFCSIAGIAGEVAATKLWKR